jgi:hypothetical protein
MHTVAERRLAWAVTGVATLWLSLAAGWEIDGPPLAGHYASSVSVAIIAENMLHWKIAGPVWQYVTERPPPSAYYCHHPWGIFWTTAALVAVLGHHDFVVRLAPVLLSVATPPLLMLLGSALWRPAAGAAAAAAFVVLPITLSFAHFNALEVPVMAWSLLAAWGFVRLAQTGRRAFLGASAAGTFMALQADWQAMPFVVALLAFALARATYRRDTFGALEHPRAYRAWWVTTALLVLSTVALYAWLFARSGKLGDLFASYDLRAKPASSLSGLDAILARRSWLELCFTEVGLALGALGVGVQVARLARLRREHEAVPLAFLVMAAVQYLAFPGGADVHVFWPHDFAVVFALGMGAMVATGARLLELRGVGQPALLALASALVPLAFMLRDAVPVLRYARETGGRFEEKGYPIDSQGDLMAVLRWLDARLPQGAAVALGRGVPQNWSQAWALAGRPVTYGAAPPRGAGAEALRAWVDDSRRMPDAEQADVAARFHVVAAGPFWIVDPDEPAAPIDAFVIDEREPTAREWYVVSGTEPVRSVAADAFATWELRVHFGQPAVAPAEEPVTLEHKRIAYDMAVDSGDSPRAAARMLELLQALTPPDAGHSMLGDGMQILGTTRGSGVAPSVTVWVRAVAESAPGTQLTAWSQVAARAPLSAIMADPVVREVGAPTAIAPQRWRPGWVYSDRVPLRKRPGTERFWIESGPPPHGPTPGSGARVTIATL